MSASLASPSPVWFASLGSGLVSFRLLPGLRPARLAAVPGKFEEFSAKRLIVSAPLRTPLCNLISRECLRRESFVVRVPRADLYVRVADDAPVVRDRRLWDL
jgi:hypothetical protein